MAKTLLANLSSSLSRTSCLCALLLFTAPASHPRSPADAFGRVPAQDADSASTLAPGVAVEREIAAGQSHRWQIFLAAGDYLRLSIDFGVADIVPELFAPDGSSQYGGTPLLGTADGNVSNSHSGVRAFSSVAEVTGNYRLEINAPAHEAATRRYVLKIEEQRPATPQDRLRVAAGRAELEGVRTRNSVTLAGRRHAIANYERALALWRESGERRGELRMSQRLVYQHRELGELQTALRYGSQAIEVAQALGERYQEANLIAQLGGIHLTLGDSQKALDAYNGARQIFAGLPNARYGEAIVVENIGVAYFRLGDPRGAIEYFNQVAPTYSSVGDKTAECGTLNNLGAAHLKLGETGEALEYHGRALALARKIGDRVLEARALGHSGDVYLALGDWRKASDCFNEELKACRTLGNTVCVAKTLKSLGDAALLSGDRESALNLLHQALNQSRLIGLRAREADTLRSLAQANYSLGNLPEAREQIEQSLDITEHLRAGVAATDLRTTFFTSAQSGFDLYMEVLMSLHGKEPAAGHDARALRASERARARSLLEQLAEANADIRQGADPRLLERERTLRQQLDAKAAARANALNNQRTGALAADFDREIAELTARHGEVEAQIRASSPRYAALTRPEPLAVPAIQQLLDQNTVLLEFALGEKRSWLWAVTPDRIISRQLPPRVEIERATRAVYELLTARQPKAGMTEAEAAARVNEADARFQIEGARLSRMLLGPLADSLRRELKGKRLLIVASGALEYLPFAALPLPSNDDSYQPLIAEHEVINLPSASVLSVMRRETAKRAAAPKTLAVMADPVFDTSDPRLMMAAGRKVANRDIAINVRSAGESPLPASGASNDSPLMRAVRSMNRPHLSRLPFSREEAEAVAALVPAKSLMKATDFRASRARATSGELGNYRIIHFATHGLLNSEHPELSGLVLSLVDEDGRAQDGFLRMHEIYNLRLPAEVVVLSACQTALGKEIKGEGLVGLTRGFMYAGAERVVASLWQVDDLATAELMKSFYRGMLKENLRPAAALRAAQLEMMKQKRRSAPYFWAAFVIQGEYK